MVIQTFFPDEREILKEELIAEEAGLSKKIRKEIITLHKLGLEDYEIKYMLSLKVKKQASLKWKS